MPYFQQVNANKSTKVDAPKSKTFPLTQLGSHMYWCSPFVVPLLFVETVPLDESFQGLNSVSLGSIENWRLVLFESFSLFVSCEIRERECFMLYILVWVFHFIYWCECFMLYIGVGVSCYILVWVLHVIYWCSRPRCGCFMLYIGVSVSYYISVWVFHVIC